MPFYLPSKDYMNDLFLWPSAQWKQVEVAIAFLVTNPCQHGKSSCWLHLLVFLVASLPSAWSVLIPQICRWKKSQVKKEKNAGKPTFCQNKMRNNLYNINLFCSIPFTCHIIPQKKFSDASSDDWGTFSLTTPWLTSTRSLTKYVCIHCIKRHQKCGSI